MYEITQWTNTAKGILAFDCKTLNVVGDPQHLSTLTCWNLRVDLAFGIIFLILFSYQLRICYKYYGKRFFKKSQRLTYLAIVLVIFWTAAYSLFNIIGLYNVTLFLVQTLFCYLLYYLMTKLSKLKTGWIILIMKVITICLHVALIAYLIIVLVAPINNDIALCPGFLDKQYVGYKITLLIIIVAMFLLCGLLLRRVLMQQGNSFLNAKEILKKNRQITKLKAIIIIVGLSEIFQLSFVFIHYDYFTDPTESCPLMLIDEGDISDNLIVFFYRFCTIHIPLAMVLWMIWRKPSEVNFHYSFFEEELDHNSRFAAKLAVGTDKMPGKRCVPYQDEQSSTE